MCYLLRLNLFGDGDRFLAAFRLLSSSISFWNSISNSIAAFSRIIFFDFLDLRRRHDPPSSSGELEREDSESLRLRSLVVATVVVSGSAFLIDLSRLSYPQVLRAIGRSNSSSES